jgi:hypothetical protein
MKIDRYTKVVLTIIAVGIIGLNFHFFKDDFIKEAHAYVEPHEHDTDEIYLFEYHQHGSHEIYDFEEMVTAYADLNCVSLGYMAHISCILP